MIFRASYSGWDMWRSWLPAKAQAKGVAKQLLKTLWKGADPTTTEMIVELAVGAFKVVDTQGNVEPCEKRNV